MKRSFSILKVRSPAAKQTQSTKRSAMKEWHREDILAKRLRVVAAGTLARCCSTVVKPYTQRPVQGQVELVSRDSCLSFLNFLQACRVIFFLAIISTLIPVVFVLKLHPAFAWLISCVAWAPVRPVRRRAGRFRVQQLACYIL